MSRRSPDTLRPDPVRSLPAAFRVAGPLAVRALLRELSEDGVPVSLYRDDEPDALLICQMLRVSPDQLEFDLSGTVGTTEDLAALESAVGVAFPCQVKTQFRLERLSVGRGQDGAVLRAPLPGVAYRIQRRDAFRVRPPAADDASCTRRVPPFDETRYRLTDLSAGGACLLLAPGSAPPEPGTIWQHCRIETADGRTIPCDLSVRRVEPVAPGARGLRVAVAFRAMPPEVLRQVQAYVIDIERRRGPRG